MNDFTAIGQLVTEARNLLDSIKGGAIRVMEEQFASLKLQFTDKLTSVNTELAKFISQEKSNVNTIFSEPDKRYQVLLNQREDIVVAGSRNYWYPVVINIPSATAFLSISRHTHADSDTFGIWNGALTFDMRVCGFDGGGRNAIASIDHHQVGRIRADRLLPDSDIPFIGKVSAINGPNQVVIWLRGETSYELACDSGLASFSVRDDGVPYNIHAGYPEVEAIAVTAGVDVSVPNVGYIRGE